MAASGKRPSAGEAALDAAVSAAGPASSMLMKAGLKRFVGLTDEDVLKKGVEAADKLAKKIDPR